MCPCLLLMTQEKAQRLLPKTVIQIPSYKQFFKLLVLSRNIRENKIGDVLSTKSQSICTQYFMHFIVTALQNSCAKTVNHYKIHFANSQIVCREMNKCKQFQCLLLSWYLFESQVKLRISWPLPPTHQQWRPVVTVGLGLGLVMWFVARHQHVLFQDPKNNYAFSLKIL